MDSASAVGDCRPRCGDCICHGGTRQSRLEGINDRGPYLDDEYRHHRKRPVDRNRSSLCLALWSGDYLLAEFLGSKEVSMAHLGPGIRFSWVWPPGKGPNTSDFFLCDRLGSPLAGERLADSFASCALCCNRHYARDCRYLGHSVSAYHGNGGRDGQMVRSVR